jgi:hypothetical protein
MEKPETLVQLLDELRQEGVGDLSNVDTMPESYALLHPKGAAQAIRLSPEECELVLDSPRTVELLAETFGSENATIELHEIGLDDEVDAALEHFFATVDEI